MNVGGVKRRIRGFLTASRRYAHGVIARIGILKEKYRKEKRENESDFIEARKRRVGMYPCGVVRDSGFHLLCIFGDNMNEEKKKNGGGCWLKKDKNGKLFMSGCLNVSGVEHRFGIFKNNHKKKDTEPDYNILYFETKVAEENKTVKAVENAFQDEMNHGEPLPF